ncbi:MAG: hypothetical protein KBS59_02545, partial [Clostridiales bacterium]|nr:hypothetical protein [Clostridiales bacterium]
IFDFAARLCGGAIGKARELLSGGNEYEMYDSCKKIISLQAGKINGAKYFAFINVIAENSDTREKISMMLDYLFAAYVDILKAKSCDEPLLSFFDGASALDFSEKFASGALEASLDAVSKIRNGLVFNTNISISSANLAKLLWAAV